MLYFADHAEAYGVDPSSFTLMGYSGGAYYAADSTRLLQKADFDMSSLVLCYSWMTGLDADKLKNMESVTGSQETLDREAETAISGWIRLRQ